ncbi:universal stress protein [Phycicoccus sonneratiae]|uniref:Universal stress protein n=1 Tax=Phycicoccus sonneratiae TaxID=2807628 RepID=A0ABS2CR29_9MICO|nr:universal stress protein [Phycicoccus sonneraticus]MBM6401591.1 universal stress protein [Phycicoccus sonneraticus]
MTIVVGYVPRRDGLAALEAAVAEAARTAQPLLVVNAGTDAEPRRRGLADRRDIDALCACLADVGVPHEVRQPSRGLAPADELVQAAAGCSARLLVVGLRRRRPAGVGTGGSTLSGVLADADCDVLVVPAADA